MATLRLDGLGKSYGDVTVVENVSLDVADGEFLVLLGPSGCGKTTTLRMIAGFVEASAGRVLIGARDVTGEPPYRRNIGLVFQSYALFPHLTVFENTAFGLRRRKIGEAEVKSRVERALALVRLDGLAARYPKQLSGGQQQRVAIARALVIEPDILLLDEPLSNLDAQLRIEVRSELRRLQKSLGITTIMVTHDQEEAMSVADRLVVLQSGRVQQVGSALDLYLRPANRFVAGFIGRGNFLEGVALEAGFRSAQGTVFPCGAPAGSVGTLLLRPEHVGLHRQQGHGMFAGRIESVRFLASSFDIAVVLAAGDRLQAQLPATPGAMRENWQAGDETFVAIDPAAMTLLQNDTGHADLNSQNQKGVSP
ncbi:MAG: ABC transporter ATP-binding protein [Beijerinckiaceae bacterium]|nr:ABC transporter ATP-binding protein [Beijerinckiaceae bacterium]